MNKKIIIYIVITVIAIYLFYKFALPLLKKKQAGSTLDISIADINMSDLTNIRISLDIINPTVTDIKLQAIVGNVQINDSNVARISYIKDIILQGQTSKVITLNVKPNFLSLPNIYDAIKKGNPLFALKGNATAENITFPIDIIFNPAKK